MTRRRRTLIAAFPILLLPLFAGVGVGTIELAAWFLLAVIWVGLFIVWGART